MDALKRLFSKSTMVRLISGIVLIAIALLTVHIGGDVLFVTTLILSLIACKELYKVFELHNKILGVIGYISVICYYACIRINYLNHYSFAFLILTVILLMAVYVYSYPKVKATDIAIILLGVLYAGVMLSYIYRVRQTPDGRYVVWLIYLCSWGCDTCAYIFGVMFGKHKMAPVLSPKKTIEGAVGGVFGSCLIGFIYASFVIGKIHMSMDIRLVFVLVCLFGSIISMMGDLFASAIKREKSVKDFGNIIPGHGGILDRFDSVIITAPIIWMLVDIMH